MSHGSSYAMFFIAFIMATMTIMMCYCSECVAATHGVVPVKEKTMMLTTTSSTAAPAVSSSSGHERNCRSCSFLFNNDWFSLFSLSSPSSSDEDQLQRNSRYVLYQSNMMTSFIVNGQTEYDDVYIHI